MHFEVKLLQLLLWIGNLLVDYVTEDIHVQCHVDLHDCTALACAIDLRGMRCKTHIEKKCKTHMLCSFVGPQTNVFLIPLVHVSAWDWLRNTRSCPAS